jgi:hypothetical protein
LLDEKGEFYGITQRTNNEQVVVKFVWTNVASDIPRWEHYFSFDEGKNWELNWAMDFLRTEKSLYYF